MAAANKAKTPTARQVAVSLKELGGRLVAVVDKLLRVGDAPVPGDAAKELSDLAAVIRQAVEPAPPSVSSAEKNDDRAHNKEGWPQDIAADKPNELIWGHDPEALRRG